MEILNYKLKMIKDKRVSYNDKIGTLSNSQVSANILRALINQNQNDRENFCVLMLNVKNEVIGTNIVHTGSVSSCPAFPRDVFKIAIISNCIAIITGHNHPSGHVDPSREDINIYSQLIKGGKILGITILDNIIVDCESDKYYSFSEHHR